MDLEGAAVLSVCARCEKQRLEGQHECICPVASGRGAWQCGAVSRSAWRQQASARKERKRERARRVCTLDRRARVEHHSASRGGIACHAGRGEGSASGGSFLCLSCAAALCARRQCWAYILQVHGKTGYLLRDRCVLRFHRRCLKSGPLIAVTKNSHV